MHVRQTNQSILHVKKSYAPFHSTITSFMIFVYKLAIASLRISDSHRYVQGNHRSVVRTNDVDAAFAAVQTRPWDKLSAPGRFVQVAKV